MLAAINIGNSLQQGLDAFFGFVPNLLAFLVILLVGWIIAKAVRTVVNKALDNLGVDKALGNSDAGRYVERVSPGAKPSRLIGAVAYWFIFLFALSAAIGALKIPSLTAFITEVQTFLPNIIVAVLIFVVAAALAGGVAGAVTKMMGDTPTGKVVAAVVPALILAIGTFMILDQLKIAHEIVTITYAALMGSAALGLALAFGLGGRQLAGEILRDAYDKGDAKKDEVKDDVEKGKERAERRTNQQQKQPQRSGTNAGAGAGGAMPPGPASA